MNYLFDACALLAFFNKETGWEHVRDLLEKAVTGEINVFMNAINLYEVYYKKLHKDGQHVARDVYNVVLDSAISIIDVFESDAIFHEAARFKAGYPVSLADSIALGTASCSGCTLVTSDHHEMDIVEAREAINFYWFR
jgi:PIN domain nuclease of toxin-antitoxin system